MNELPHFIHEFFQDDKRANIILISSISAILALSSYSKTVKLFVNMLIYPNDLAKKDTKDFVKSAI